MNLLREALIASGAKSKELRHYINLWQKILNQALPYIPPSGDRERAKALFDWLWQTKPRRYKLGGSFRLTEVIQAQIDPDKEEIGNCLGLTLLYNTLAQGIGLKTGAIYLENAFDRGPHIFSVLYLPEGSIDIENIFPYGFDYKGHLHLPRLEWGDRELIAEIYVSRGNELFEQGRYKEAIRDYEIALRLNPDYEKAFLNKLMAQERLKS